MVVQFCILTSKQASKLDQGEKEVHSVFQGFRIQDQGPKLQSPVTTSLLGILAVGSCVFITSYVTFDL